MAITIRPGALDRDRDASIGLFRRYLNEAYDTRRFEWLYRDNPAGAGRLWVASDATTGEVVGTAGAFPREIHLEGREAIGWVLGDFCVAERYRALGPALALQRRCLDELGATGAVLFHDFPHRRLLPIYQRLRIGPPRLMRRLVRLLRVDGRIERLVGSRLLGRGLGAAANAILTRRRHSIRPPAAVVTGLLEGACGPEFTDLADKVSADYGLCLRRSAAYVDWRYRRNPIRPHDIVTVRQDGRLAAWAALTQDGAAGALVDVFGVPDPELIASAVEAAVAALGQRGCATVSVSLLDSHPWVALFRRLGFSPREESPVILHPLPASGLSAAALAAAPAFLTQGDQDA
ncbi:MAG TPA: GNAT family N-acetyltransferase [Methylomirabilota bacterium]